MVAKLQAVHLDLPSQIQHMCSSVLYTQERDLSQAVICILVCQDLIVSCCELTLLCYDLILLCISVKLMQSTI